ncbi:MAG: lipase family protein [Flavobacteriales bacterium]|jgi:pimeloyl-ACP methyl ester carboxylesterase
MNQLLRLFFLVIVLVCSFRGKAQITDYTLETHFTEASINIYMQVLGIPNGLLEIQSEVDFYKIKYMTPHPNGTMVEVSGALCVPSDLDCPLPMASYQHGTISARNEAPSNPTGEALIGVLYAAVGYITVMPDYIGLGDSQLFHPYVHADSQASASLDMIRSARDLQETLGYNWDEQLFIFGYSQGGHATAALQRLIETESSDEFTITASAPMSGPYDISGIQAGVLTSDQVYPTPGYLPYVVLSYQEVYGNIYNDLSEVFLPEYAEIIPDLFDGNTTMSVINSAFPAVPADMLQPAFIEAYNNDPNHPMRLALADNDVMDWAPQVPTRLYYCIADDQVNYMNSVVALENFTELGSTSVQALDLGQYDHGGCAPLALLFGLDYFESLKVDNCNISGISEITDSFSISPNPSNGIVTFHQAVNDWIEVYDATGRKVASSWVSNTADWSALGAGCYVIKGRSFEPTRMIIH